MEINYSLRDNTLVIFALVIITSQSVKHTNTKKMPDENNNYDDEPVYFCKRCLSLNIREIPQMEDQFYCADCGTVEMETASIEEWKELYKKKYGHDFIVKKELKWPYWC